MGTVYKFKSLQNGGIDHVLKMLTFGEFYFSPPGALNDPFEYLAESRFDLQPDSVRENFWMQNAVARSVLVTMPPNERLRYIEEIEQGQDTIPEVLFQNGSQGIFCTCETWDNRVLWSHYADNHRGVAIEIEPQGAEVLELSRTQVRYEDVPPEIDFYGGCHISEVTRICATKHKDWEYEREVRFFCSAGVHRIPPANIVSLHLGMGCAKAYPKEVKKLIAALRASNPAGKVWQMICDRNSGKLKKSLVS